MYRFNMHERGPSTGERLESMLRKLAWSLTIVVAVMFLFVAADLSDGDGVILHGSDGSTDLTGGGLTSKETLHKRAFGIAIICALVIGMGAAQLNKKRP